MDIKGNKNTPKAETVYVVDGDGGQEYEISKEHYNEINKVIDEANKGLQSLERPGVFIFDANTQKEMRIVLRHIVATRIVERTIDRIV